MKNILLIGKLLVNIPSPEKLVKKDANYFVAHDMATVQEIFGINKVIDIVIVGAGIELEKRLDIVRYIFHASDTVTMQQARKVLCRLLIMCWLECCKTANSVPIL